MKKVYFSMGAMLLAGVVLASCGNSSSLSKPKKGKAVDSVDIKVGSFSLSDYDLKIEKNSENKDVFPKFIDSYLVGYKSDVFDYAGGELAYSMVATENTTYTGTNYLDASNYLLHKNLKVKVSGKTSKEGYISINQESENKSSSKSYYNSKTSFKMNMNYGDMSTKQIRNEVKTFGGDLGSSTKDLVTSNNYDFGVYEKNSNEYVTNSFGMKQSEKESEETYKYFNKTEKSTDEDYGKRYYGYDKSGQYQNYKLLELGNYPYEIQDSVTAFDSYSEEYKDLYEASFELTDKYIILKSKVNCTDAIAREADAYFNKQGISATAEQFVSKVNEIREEKYKGSYTEYEIWLSYFTTLKDEPDCHLITCDYYKKKEVSKVNYSGTYDDAYFEEHGITKDEVKDLAKGKKYTLKGSSIEITEYAANNKKFDSKIKNFKKKAEKNNIFKDMKMYLEQ